MKEGIIDFWNDKRGFGFVAVSRSERYFVHVSQVLEGPVGSLQGLKAAFDIKLEDTTGKLPQAVNVRIISEGEDGAN